MRRILYICLLAVCLVAPGIAQDQDDIADLDSKAARKSRAGVGGRLSGPSNDSAQEIVSAFVKASHGRNDATTQSLVAERQNLDRGRVLLRLRQRVAGLEVYGTYLKAALTPQGELVSVVENLADTGAELHAAVIDYSDALAAVLRHRYPREEVPAEIASEENKVTYARGNRFYRDPSVTRMAVPGKNGKLRVGYLVETWTRDNVLWHTVVSGNGKILLEELRTASDRYNVFTNSPTRTPQAIVNGPGAGNAQSPSGWVSSNTTTGNNVDAYLDRDNNNGADAGSRPVSQTQEFLTAAQLTQAPTISANQAVAVTNLFYLNNFLHDKLYRHGFTAAAGNFQENNFGLGGAGSDSVNAEAQDGGGTNNANFATPSDGFNPRMQMYLWTTANPNRDGDVDSDIVYHEYGHGLTWRMIGGMSGRLAGAIGEGMSDTVAIYVNGDDVVAEYSTNNTTRGIRRFRYTNYPNTYGDATTGSVHNDGEIYAATMWKLRELWLASGRSMDTLWDRVIGGMDHTPSGPAFEDMRDGILTEITDPAEECIVWDAFAQFGIGVGANGVQTPFSITESFAKPAQCTGTPNTAPTVNITSGPASGTSVQQGTSVTYTATANDAEQGNLTASIQWSSNLQGSLGTGGTLTRNNLVVGTHTITATVTDSGGLSGSASRTLIVTSAPQPTIVLETDGYKVKGVRRVDLTWTGATGSNVDVYLGSSIVATPQNTGAFTHMLGGKGPGTFTYKVCNTGTTTCSNVSTVAF
jgi:Zn-dependent metalloprotease